MHEVVFFQGIYPYARCVVKILFFFDHVSYAFKMHAFYIEVFERILNMHIFYIQRMKNSR